MRNIVLILFFIFASIKVNAQFTSTQKTYLNPFNILLNSGAEQGKSRWNSNGTFELEITAPLIGFGDASFKFTSTGASDYVRSDLYDIPNLFGENKCYGELYYKTLGTSYSFQVRDQTNAIMATTSLPANTSWEKVKIDFECVTGDSYRIYIDSSGVDVAIYFDNVLLGFPVGSGDEAVVTLQNAYNNDPVIDLGDATGPIVLKGNLANDVIITVLGPADATQFTVFDDKAEATNFVINEDLFHKQGSESQIPFLQFDSKFLYDNGLKYDATSQTLLVENIDATNYINLPPFDSTKTVIDINKVGHGFVVGNLIRHNGATWVYSSNYDDVQAEVFCVVNEVVDVDNFKCTMNGYISGLAGLVSGDVYFLDATGTFTSTEPSGSLISKPVLWAISATEAIFHNQRGLTGGTGGGASTLQEAYNAGQIIITNPLTPVEIDDLEFIDNFINSALGFNLQYNGTNIAQIENATFSISQNTDLRFYDNDSSNYVELRSPSVISSNITFTLPGADGAAGEFLQTDGAGNLSFAQVNTDATKTRLEINQVAHGFSVGDLLRISGANTFTEAQANTDTNAEVACIVNEIIDVDNFVCAFNGYVSGLAGLTTGETYFLSESVAGAYTLTEPATPNISKPVFIALSTTEILFFNMRGLVGSSGGGGGTLQDAYDSGSLIATDPLTPVEVDDLKFIDDTINSAIGFKLQYNSNNIAMIENGRFAINQQVELRFYDDDGSNYVELKSPSVISSNITFALPDADGAAGEFLQTDGAGNLSFAQVVTDATKTRDTFNQVGHGFVVGDLLRISGANTFAEAQADSDTNAEVACIVSDVIDVDNFECAFNGRVNGLAGLTAGQVYFLDENTAGAFTSTEPVDPDISKPVFVAINTTDIIFYNMRGLLGGAGGGSGTLQDAYDAGDTINTGAGELFIDNFTINGSEIQASNMILDSGTVLSFQVDNTNEMALRANYVELLTENSIRFNDADDSNYVALKSPSTVTTNKTLTLPANSDIEEDVIKTNGSGVLSFGQIKAIVEAVNQVGHGFSKCNVLRHNGTSFILAQANNATNAEVYGVVSRVIGVNDFVITISGNMDLTGCGLSASETYFLSDTVAGGLTSTEPSDVDEVSLPLIKTKDANSGYLFQYRGRIIY